MNDKNFSSILISKCLHPNSLKFGVNNTTLPFGAKYKTIDFSINNAINSKMDSIIISGPYSQKLNNYLDTSSSFCVDNFSIDTFFQKDLSLILMDYIDFLDSKNLEYILFSTKPYICDFNYEKMLEFHIANHFNITKVITESDSERDLGIYLINWSTLRRELLLNRKHPFSSFNFRNLIEETILKFNIESKKNNHYNTNSYNSLYTGEFLINGFCASVDNIKDFWNVNMDILEHNYDFSNKSLSCNSIISNLPSKIESSSKLNHSLLGENCVISGEVNNSIIFSNAIIPENTVIEHSIILDNVSVPENTSIKNSIVGKNFCVHI